MQHASFKEFVDSVERKINYKIYYANDWVDSMRIDIAADKQSIDQVLSKSLADSGFTFIITSGNKIILSKGYSIKTSFKEEYEKYLANHLVKIDSSIYALPENKLEEEKIINDEFKLFKIGNPSEMNNGDFAVLSGNIKEANTGLPVVGGVVYVEKIKVGAASNKDGFYSLVLPKGQHIVEFRTIGMRTARRNLILYSNGGFNVEMYEKVNQLEEVTVTANKESCLNINRFIIVVLLSYQP